LDKTLKAQATKGKADQWDCIKLKSSCRAEETTSRVRDNPQNVKRISANCSSETIHPDNI
jgi:hypothetical protein